MKEPSRPEPRCTEPVAEPLAQYIWEKLKHDLGFPPPPGSPPPRHFERPVSWLLGRQMMGSIKGTLLYTAFGSKLDPRDWMQARAFPFKEKAAALKFWKTLASGDAKPATCSSSRNHPPTARTPPSSGAGAGSSGSTTSPTPATA